MKTYFELNALAAESFLTPRLFLTDFDSTNRDLNAASYKEGYETGQKAKAFVISIGSVWGADMKDGSSITSCTGIGYHARTAHLLAGFLDSGCKIVVHRHTAAGLTSTTIQDAGLPSPFGTRLDANGDVR